MYSQGEEKEESLNPAVTDYKQQSSHSEVQGLFGFARHSETWASIAVVLIAWYYTASWATSIQFVLHYL